MAERSGQASAAVGGGAAAQSKYDAFRSGVDRGANQLAGAEVDAANGSRSAGEMRSIPLAAANSTTAVRGFSPFDVETALAKESIL